MADEIRGQNVVQVCNLRAGFWAAFIGPDPQNGVCAFGRTPAIAVSRLAQGMDAAGWICDPSYRPALPGFPNATVRT